MDILTVVLVVISIAISIILLIKLNKSDDTAIDAKLNKQRDQILEQMRNQNSELRTELISNSNNNTVQMARMLNDSIEKQYNQQRSAAQDMNKQQIDAMKQAFEAFIAQLDTFSKRLSLLSTEQEQKLENIRQTVDSSLKQLREDNNKQLEEMRKLVDEKLKANLEVHFNQQRTAAQDSSKQQSEIISRSLEAITGLLDTFSKRLSQLSTEQEQKLENIRQTVDSSLKLMREDNNKKLDEMRKTVDDKLQTELERRMKESFAQVQNLLEGVQKDIGSMRTLAEDVGGLKRSLTNVKTRGMIGEFQLESILSEIFAQSQYEKNAHTNPDSPNAVVEFAIKIPTEDDEFVYLPIDSKFPRDTYDAVIAATDQGEKPVMDSAIKAYIQKLKECAKDIKTKYIAPPYTTEYAIMFLPTESMYADAVNHGMLEELFKTYRVYITGPSTIAALLGSMQMSFNNIAIQKRAGEVFTVLTEVQKEFGNFAEALGKMKKHLDATSSDLSDLMGKRTNQMNRKLNGVSRLSLGDTSSILLIPDEEE